MPNVFYFEQSDRQANAENRTANFGQSFFSRPNLIASYFNAAHSLLEKAITEKTTSDLGLPIFYLQRHTTELLLKKLHDVAEAVSVYSDGSKVEDGVWQQWIAKKQEDHEKLVKKNKHPAYSHNLAWILTSATDLLRAQGCTPPPTEFADLSHLIESFENGHPDRARYTTIRLHRGDESADSSSLPRGTEVVLDLGKIQDLLDIIITTHMRADHEDDDTFLADLVRVNGSRFPIRSDV